MWAEPPRNGGYLVAAYLVATGILAGYFGSLWNRARKSVSGERGKTKGASGEPKTLAVNGRGKT